MANYIICPRCELNFIDADEQEFCEVCLKELSGAKTFSDDFEEEEMMEETELCPLCGENYMRFGEQMCEECKKKSQYEDEATEDELADDDESWRSYIDDDEPEDLGIEIDDDEFADEEEDEDETFESEEEDFEYVSPDDYYDDEDEDDEDEDDDDDF